jgi:hypothetical protein
MIDETDGLFGRMTNNEMIEGLKTKINSIQS